MCDCSEEDGDRDPLGPGVPPDVLTERTRLYEAALPGEPVPAGLWAIFFGLESGAIPWIHYRRMQESRLAAMQVLELRSRFRRVHRRIPSIVCEAPRAQDLR